MHKEPRSSVESWIVTMLWVRLNSCVQANRSVLGQDVSGPLPERRPPTPLAECLRPRGGRGRGKTTRFGHLRLADYSLGIVHGSFFGGRPECPSSGERATPLAKFPRT